MIITMIGALCVLVPGVVTAGIFAARESGKNHRKQEETS